MIPSEEYYKKGEGQVSTVLVTYHKAPLLVYYLASQSDQQSTVAVRSYNGYFLP